MTETATETATIHHKLTLEADLNAPVISRDGSRELGFDFKAKFDPTMRAYIVNRGDTFEICVEVTGDPTQLPGLEVHCLNLLSCPAPIGLGQIFHTVFRQNPDIPDNLIFASGTAKFRRRTQEPPTNPPKLVFDMVLPEFAAFNRAGDFAIVFRLALASQTGEIFTFFHDPEVCVKGSLP